MKDQATNENNIFIWIYATGFCLLWVMLPAVFHPAYRPDVVELQIIAKEWQLSTAKHPMLPAWMLEVVNLATNNSFVAPFIAAQLCVLLALGSIWSLAKTILPPKLALLGTLAMFPYWFFTIESIKFNQNIALIGLWTLTISRLFLAIKWNRLCDWIIVGITLGFAFHAKYSAAFLVVAILLYMTICPFPRQRWKSIGPYLTTAIAFLVFLPQLIWMYQHDFVCLRYASSEPDSSQTLLEFVFSPLVFLVSQLSFVTLSIVVLVPLLGWKWKVRKTGSALENEAKIFLGYMIGVPLGLHVLICMVTRVQLNSDYGAAFWPFFGVYLLLTFERNVTPQAGRQSFRLFVFAELVMVVAFIFQATGSTYLLGTARRFQFPMQALGVASDQIWSDQTSQPCPYTTGDWWIAGNAAIAMKDRPRVLFYWKGIEKMNASPTGLWASDADVNEKGGLVFWQVSKKDIKGTAQATPDISFEVPKYVLRRFPDAVIRPEPIIFPYTTKANVAPLQIGVAVVPPKS